MKKDVYGSSKLAFHEDKVRALREKKITAPIYVRVKPTNKCNHRCVYCSYSPDADEKCIVSEEINLQDEIPYGKMIEILEDFNEMGVKAVTYSGGGEPLVYPFITDVLRKTLDHGIDLSIITNGQLLNGERAELLAKAKWVRISTDSCTNEMFSLLRKVPDNFFEKLRENIRNFATIKNPDCELGINFIVCRENSEFVYESAKLFKELGANNIRFTPVYRPDDFWGYHEQFKQKIVEQIERAKEELTDDNFRIYDNYGDAFILSGVKERKYPRCFIMQIVPVIGADSRVYFCHDKTYTKSGRLGSIKDKSFKELWFSKEAAEKLNNFDPKEGCQHHCTYDSRNMHIGIMMWDFENLDKYKSESEVHKNFI